MHLVQVFKSETQVQKSVKVEVKLMGSVPVVTAVQNLADIWSGTNNKKYLEQKRTQHYGLWFSRHMFIIVHCFF